MLSASYEGWDQQLDAATHALAQGLGSLAIAVCVPVYLASLPPHKQLDSLHTLLLPLLRERGVPVVWGNQQLAIGSFCDPVHTDTLTDDSLTPFPSSYPVLCRAILPLLAPPALTEQWLEEEAHSLPAVLAMSLAAQSWHRAVLTYDPEGSAGHWLKKWKGEELMVVDYRIRLEKLSSPA